MLENIILRYSMSKFPTVSEVLTGKVAVGETVSIRGWVRTRPKR